MLIYNYTVYDSGVRKPQERLTVEEALRAHTVSAAYAEFQESRNKARALIRAAEEAVKFAEKQG